MSKVFIQGVKKGSGDKELESVIKKVFLDSTDNLSWLKKGDLVLLKPALNSPDPYPSTTHPLSVKVLAEVIKEKGGKVIVGDQSGIEHVVQDKNRVVKGSSADLFQRSGMKGGSDAKFIGFEQGDWGNDFVYFHSEKAKSWPNGFYITKWIEKADHIINLPRISTHGQAGVTLGFKNWVGLLRDDSRMVFHANGPYFSFIKSAAKNGEFDFIDDGTNTFFEKMVEISLATKDKLRLTLFTGTKAQLTMGPDASILKLGNKRLLKSSQVSPEEGVVFASVDQVAAEVFAITYMKHLYSQVSFINKFWQKILVRFNGQIKELDKEATWNNPFVKHALFTGLGSDELELECLNVSDGLMKNIANYLEIKK